MKQTLFMLVLTFIGTVGVLTNGPAIAVTIYYLFAVLRPQSLWHWVLPQDVTWSWYVAMAAILGSVAYAIGALPVRPIADAPYRGMAWTHKVYVAFGAWVCLTYFTALNQDVAYFWLIEYVKIFTMLMVATFAVRTIRQLWTIYLLTAGALAYIAYEVNSLYLLDGRLDIYRSGYGGLDNNGAGLMLAMAVPLCIYAWEGARAWWRWIFAASIPILIHAVLMTYSRGAMLALLLTTPVVLMRSRRRLQFTLLTIAMACLVPLMAGREIRARFFTINQYESDASANSRFDSWRAGIRIANDYPLFGAGIRNSNLISYRYGADMEGRTIHSQYIQILADSGYPAVALYVVALGGVLFVTSVGRRRLKRDLRPDAVLARSMLSGVQTAMLVFAIGSTFLSLEVFELPYVLAFLGGQLYLLAVPAAVVVQRPQPAAPGSYRKATA